MLSRADVYYSCSVYIDDNMEETPVLYILISLLVPLSRLQFHHSVGKTPSEKWPTLCMHPWVFSECS